MEMDGDGGNRKVTKMGQNAVHGDLMMFLVFTGK